MEGNIVVVGLSGVVLGGCRGEVFGSCQVSFRPRSLLVPWNVTADFDVEDIYVGTRRQLYGMGTVPAEVFAGDLGVFDVGGFPPTTFSVKEQLDVPVPLKFDVCGPGVGIRVIIFNRRVLFPRVFRCAFYGVVEGGS
jgi:hypothetical protein